MRIPAALNGITASSPRRGACPPRALPLSRAASPRSGTGPSVACPARSRRDGGEEPPLQKRTWRPATRRPAALCRRRLDDAVAAAVRLALSRLAKAGARPSSCRWPARGFPRIMTKGALVRRGLRRASQSCHGRRKYDPRVASRIRLGAKTAARILRQGGASRRSHRPRGPHHWACDARSAQPLLSWPPGIARRGDDDRYVQDQTRGVRKRRRSTSRPLRHRAADPRAGQPPWASWVGETMADARCRNCGRLERRSVISSREPKSPEAFFLLNWGP